MKFNFRHSRFKSRIQFLRFFEYLNSILKSWNLKPVFGLFHASVTNGIFSGIKMIFTRISPIRCKNDSNFEPSQGTPVYQMSMPSLATPPPLILNFQCVGVAIEGIDIKYMGIIRSASKSFRSWFPRGIYCDGSTSRPNRDKWYSITWLIISLILHSLIHTKDKWRHNTPIFGMWHFGAHWNSKIIF